MTTRMTIFLVVLLLSVAVQASESTAVDCSSLQTIEHVQVDLFSGVDQSKILFTPQKFDSTIYPEIGRVMLAAGCCKICRKGKACGDSCISRKYDCHQPPGCACDG